MPAGQDTGGGGQISHTDDNSQMLGGGAECSGATAGRLIWVGVGVPDPQH